MKYQFIAAHTGEHAVARMCRVLGVARSAYYAWRPGPESQRQKANRALSEHLKDVFENSQQTYGSRRLRALRQEGIRCGRGHIVRLMRATGLAVPLTRRHVVTTKTNPLDPTGENKLGRNFSATSPNQKWLADITYVTTDEGDLYLAAVLDLFSRKIIGWVMDDNLRDELTQAALRMALLIRQPEPGLLHHSDRGSRYTSAKYRALFEEAGIQASRSRAHNCFDNAPMESFWGKVKTECMYRYHFRTRSETRTAIFAYLESFYNRQRLHSMLGYQSPQQFEQAFGQIDLSVNPRPGHVIVL